MTAALDQRLQTIAEQIQAGDTIAAQESLAQLKGVKLPRAAIARMATLARQANLPAISVRLLNPVVRATRRIPTDASDLEKAEYAAALTGIGAGEEALELLKGIDAKTLPQVYLFRSYALMT